MGKVVQARHRGRFLRCYSVRPDFWNVSLVNTKKKVLALDSFSTAALRDQDSYVGESLTLCTYRETLTGSVGTCFGI